MASSDRLRTVSKSVPTQRSQGRHPTRRSERTRIEVLDAAAKCISSDGFSAASTARIAEEAGVTWGVMQYHFGDKDGLFDALLEHGMQETERRFDILREEVRSRDALRERMTVAVDGGLELFSQPLAKAATEIAINTRSSTHSDGGRDAYILDLNQRLSKYGSAVMMAVVGDRPLANKLSLIYLVALSGFEVGLMQHSRPSRFRSARNVLIDMMLAYANREVLE